MDNGGGFHYHELWVMGEFVAICLSILLGSFMHMQVHGYIDDGYMGMDAWTHGLDTSMPGCIHAPHMDGSIDAWIDEWVHMGAWMHLCPLHEQCFLGGSLTNSR